MASLAVKYRPKTFDDVSEQKLIVEILENQCKSEELANRNFLLIGPAGCGKALTLDSKILTTSGYVTMADIQVGDEVFTGSGNRGIVSGVYPQDVHPIYRITLQDRTYIDVSDDHLNVFYRYNEDKKCREDYCMSTKDMLQMFKSSRFKLRIDVPHVDWPRTDVPIDPYLLGALLGDGSLSTNFQFSNAEADVVSKVDLILRRDWGKMLRKCPGDNVDYDIVNVNASKHKYTFTYRSQTFDSIDAMAKELVTQGYPKFDGETILKLASNSALNVLKHYPELQDAVTCTTDSSYATWVEGDPLLNALRALDVCVKSVDKHIPKMYLYNCYEVRVSLLQGLYDTDGFTDKGGSTTFTTCSPSLSDDFAFLVRSLGIRDTIVSYPSKYKHNGTYVYTGSTAYDHNLKIPNELTYCTSIKHCQRRKVRQNLPLRNIVSIEYLKDEKCQCIYVDHPDHTFIVNGFIPTHNTTIARIMANTLNHNVGEPLEIDAASHSGVEGMREIIRQAQQYPIGCKYKTFIVDECFSGDTKVLTNEGFKAFNTLTHNELIAQYDEGIITFVKPLRWIEKDYDGDGYYFNPGYKACEVLMTAHHVQPIVNVSDPGNSVHREAYIEDLEFSEGDRVDVVGDLEGSKDKLTPLDEVVIASKLYASMTPNANNSLQTDCCISNGQIILSPEMYITLLSRLAQANIQYKEIVDQVTGNATLLYSLPKCEGPLNSWFDLQMFNRAGVVDLIDKIADWSSACDVQDIGTPIREANAEFLKNWREPTDDLRYFAGIESNVQFIASLCYLAGAPVEVVNPNTLRYWNVGLSTPSKRKHHINDKVYCVEVPSHNIIVQASGVPFVTGNCHALSSAAWQSVLKTLEESPARSVFFFATTNPEKIPATILSRVQTFQLSKISLEGIVKRLKHVCDAEIAEGRNLTYSEDALYFLGKLANGGMRDALTTLDKALAFSSDITVENLSKSLNLPNYDDYFILLGAYAKKDNTAITKLIDQVYNSGVNFIRWFEGFHSFVINVTKFIFLQDINATVIPSYYLEKISKYTVKHSVVCLKLANKLLTLISDLKSTQYLQEVALTYLCSPTGGQ